jgi:hypothetical protein
MEGSRYRLVRGHEVLGTVTCTSAAYPWFTGKFEPSPAYSAVAPLFVRALELLEAEALDEWDAAYAAAAGPGLWLEPVGGGPALTEVILHVCGNEVRWRS